MQTRFVCLANSFKEGGRCVAGIELDLRNNPTIFSGKPKWIRPVYTTTEHGQIPNHIAEPFQILDILEIELTGVKPEGYQSENVTFKANSLKKIGNFNRETLINLCENRTLIFGNKGKAVSHDSIGYLNYSLMLVDVSQFEIVQVVYDDHLNKPKFRIVFNHNHVRYDLPITDPVFLHSYQANKNLLANTKKLVLTLSLGVVFENWYYKLIAGVIFMNDE